jgi:hypothetical protein
MNCDLDIKSGHVEPWTALQTAAYSLLDTGEGLIFDEEKHLYTLNGIALPSVTGVLKAEGFIDTRFYDEYSRNRGTLIHLATEYDDSGDLDEDTLDPVIVPYVEAWRKFKKESGFIVDSSETPLCNKTHRYAGKIDRRGHFPSGTLRRAAVELHNDGTYKLYPFTDRQDVQVWLSALACYQWKQSKRRAA